MKRILTWLTGMFLISLCLLGCASVVKTDLKSLSDTPEGYSEPIGKYTIVIITTDLKSVVDAPENYFGKNIELSGYVQENSFEQGINDWRFILEDKGESTIDCYEWKFNDADLPGLEIALRQAAKDHDQITVLGKLERGTTIDLELIEIGGQTYNSDRPLWQYD